MHFLRNKITPCFSTQSLRGGSSTPAELHLLGAQDDAFDRKYWHEGWKSLAQFNFPKRSIEANVCSTQKRRSQAKFFGSNAGNSLLIFDVDLMNEDLQVLKHLSVCKEANFLYSFAISFFKISTVYLFNFRYHVSEIFFIRNQCIQELFSATFSCVVLRTRGEPGSNCMFGYHIVTLVTAVTFNFMCCKHSNLVLHERNLRNPGIFLTDR